MEVKVGHVAKGKGGVKEEGVKDRSREGRRRGRGGGSGREGG